MNVIAIFDVGKTNKKVLLFNENYEIVWAQSTSFLEIKDEDGFPSEDLNLLTDWVLETYNSILNTKEYTLKAVNFSAYGASIVAIDESNIPLTPLYNYLKPYPENLKKQFYDKFDCKETFENITSSPEMGSLNSGLQIFRMQQEKPDIFNKTKYFLHLPQYLSSLITGQFYTDSTSIGCHTSLWDFTKMKYHRWITDEKIDKKLPPFHFSEYPIKLKEDIWVGVGLHDSSAALVPYLASFKEPFILISTGTWNITFNPFANFIPRAEAIQNDCLYYLNYKEKPVKASRLFAGNEHEIQTARLANFFKVQKDTYKCVKCNKAILKTLEGMSQAKFEDRDLSNFETYEVAYHLLIKDIINQQVASTKLVLGNNSLNKIYVDGGFSKNQVFMHLLAKAYPKKEVYASDISQASSLGAAVVIHQFWNKNPLPEKLVSLKKIENEYI
jgi:L-fuculokinase